MRATLPAPNRALKGLSGRGPDFDYGVGEQRAARRAVPERMPVSKRGVRGKSLGWAALAAGLAWAGPSQAQGQDLVGTYWQDLIGQRGLAPEWHPQRLGKMMAWATAESLYVQPVDIACPLALCSECHAGFAKPLAWRLPFAVPNSAPFPFAIVRSEGGSEHNAEPGMVTVVFARPNGALHKATASWSPGGAAPLEWKSGTLPEVPSAGIPALVLPASGFDGSGDSAALVLGTKGLGLRVTWDGSGIKAVDLGLPVDDYTARGGRYLGTAHGGIYRFTEYPKLEKVAQPLHTRIRALDSTGALGSDGDFLFVRNGAWTASPTPVPASTLAWKIRWTQDGLAARLWTGARNPIAFKLPETPTAIRSITPSHWMGSVNGAPVYFFGTQPMDFTVVAEDKDGGFAAPIVRRRRGSEITTFTSVFQAGIPGFGFQGQTRVDGCAATGACLSGGAPAITGRLTSDSLEMKLPAIAGSLNLMCPNLPYMAGVRDTVVHIALEIRHDDRVEIILGKDTLAILGNHPIGIVDRAAWWLHGAGAEMRSRFDAAGRRSSPRAGAGGVKGRAPTTPRFPR